MLENLKAKLISWSHWKKKLFREADEIFSTLIWKINELLTEAIYHKYFVPRRID